MKKKIYIGLVALAATACDYNDKYFDGLDEMVNETEKVVETKNITLAEADYATAGVKTTYFDSQEAAVEALVKYVKSKYYTLDEGSAINIKCNVATTMSETMKKLNTATCYTLTADDYNSVWGEETPAKYLSPKTESKIANVLATDFAEAEAGDYVAVTYKYDEYEPNPADDEISAEYTKTTEVAEGNYVIAANKDGNYYAFGYFANPSNTYGYCVSEALTLKDNKFDGSALDYALTLKKTEAGYAIIRSDAKCLYMKGTYDNFNIGSFPATEGGDFTITAIDDDKFAMVNVAKSKTVKYDVSHSSFGAYSDEKIAATETAMIDVELFKEAKVVVSKCASIKGVNKYVLYKYDGSKWAIATEAYMLTAEDYTSMGQKYGNLSTTALPAEYLPAFLNNTVTYPTEGLSKTLAYFYYGADKLTVLRADEYVYTAGAWTMPATTEELSFQIVNAKGEWKYDPSVVITLAAGKGIEASALFYQTVTDWVWENVDTPNGITKKGDGYVTSYGNNEYYTGASAYQNNVDLRAASARDQYSAEYGEMSDEEVVAAMKQRVTEVFGYALSALYPDATNVEGIEVTYTINFVVYDGTSHNYQIVYKVTGPATFEYVEGSLTELN